MSRIYGGARAVLEEAGYDPAEVTIEGTGKAGNVTKGDAEAFVAERGPAGGAAQNIDAEPRNADWPKKRDREAPAPAESPPTQADIIRQGLVEGLSNQEIYERVKTVHPQTKMKPGDVSVVISDERHRQTDWWTRHAKRVVKHRPRVRLS